MTSSRASRSANGTACARPARSVCRRVVLAPAPGAVRSCVRRALPRRVVRQRRRYTRLRGGGRRLDGVGRTTISGGAASVRCAGPWKSVRRLHHRARSGEESESPS
jgi:hypothetical protein